MNVDGKLKEAGWRSVRSVRFVPAHAVANPCRRKHCDAAYGLRRFFLLHRNPMTICFLLRYNRTIWMATVLNGNRCLSGIAALALPTSEPLWVEQFLVKIDVFCLIRSIFLMAPRLPTRVMSRSSRRSEYRPEYQPPPVDRRAIQAGYGAFFSRASRCDALKPGCKSNAMHAHQPVGADLPIHPVTRAHDARWPGIPPSTALRALTHRSHAKARPVVHIDALSTP